MEFWIQTGAQAHLDTPSLSFDVLRDAYMNPNLSLRILSYYQKLKLFKFHLFDFKCPKYCS